MHFVQSSVYKRTGGKREAERRERGDKAGKKSKIIETGGKK